MDLRDLAAKEVDREPTKKLEEKAKKTNGTSVTAVIDESKRSEAGKGMGDTDAQRKLEIHALANATMKWKSLFAENKMVTRGMNLQYIAPTIKNGVKWKFAAKPSIYCHNDVYFVIKFDTIEDRDVVLYSGSYMINSKLVVVKVWTVNFDFENEVLKTIPLWIQLPKLPLNCWEDNSLSRIGSTLGIPIYADACTTRVERILYARILVEMDVTKPLPKQIMVEDPNGREFEENVWYDWMPQYCTKCLQLGHVCQEPQKEETKQRERDQKPQQFWRRKGQVEEKQDKEAAPQVIKQDDKQKGIEQTQKEFSP
ncbi:uncharacterized protein [Nicotiana sylvestris]|uniref:uncharacterized protein n=1 Tax=Nicotiana sylvestris TaxID=4096 RepID=UPI00388C6611